MSSVADEETRREWTDTVSGREVGGEGVGVGDVSLVPGGSPIGSSSSSTEIELHLTKPGESQVDLEIENEVLESLLKSYGEMVPVAIAFDRAIKIILNKCPQSSSFYF